MKTFIDIEPLFGYVPGIHSVQGLTSWLDRDEPRVSCGWTPNPCRIDADGAPTPVFLGWHFTLVLLLIYAILVSNVLLALEVRAGSVGLLDIDSVAGFNPVARAMACAVFWRVSDWVV